MKLEDRLGSHFIDVTDAMAAPPPRLDAVVHAGSGHGLLARVLLGGAVGAAGVIGAFGLLGFSLGDFGWREDEPRRMIISPFVSIEGRLTQEADIELFTVTTDQPSYWRIAGLDTYEDGIWKLEGDFSPQDSELPGQDLGGSRLEVVQEFKIEELSAIWLPAAPTPTEVIDASAEITWNSESSSLAVSNHTETSDGIEYDLISQAPNFSVEELQAAPETVPASISSRYLRLPVDVPTQVGSLARDLTAEESTTYDKMLALQTHFQDYDYSVDLGPREGDVVSQFLSERKGFAQQFSGTFALMARSIGVPARVAVGFTWGDPINQPDPETGKQTYSVSNQHAHAWPEVYFEGLGWVAFEPTPGRGLPSTGDYSGLAPAQSSAAEPTEP